MEAPKTIRDFVDAVSRADGERAGLLVTEDATFRLPGERDLPAGEAGARAFAAKHAESGGRKPSVELVDAERQSGDRWVASLRFTSREVASGETMYEMTVGGLFTLDGDRISALQAFPSYEEAVAAASE
jgi:ketosteroid isomerase-like protein